jgi:hypothetical protein
MACPSNKEDRMKRTGFSGPTMNDGNDGRRQNRRNGKDRTRKDGKTNPHIRLFFQFFTSWGRCFWHIELGNKFNNITEMRFNV